MKKEYKEIFFINKNLSIVIIEKDNYKYATLESYNNGNKNILKVSKVNYIPSYIINYFKECEYDVVILSKKCLYLSETDTFYKFQIFKPIQGIEIIPLVKETKNDEKLRYLYDKYNKEYTSLHIDTFNNIYNYPDLIQRKLQIIDNIYDDKDFVKLNKNITLIKDIERDLDRILFKMKKLEKMLL